MYYSIRCDFFYLFSRNLNTAFVGREHIPPSLLDSSCLFRAAWKSTLSSYLSIRRSRGFVTRSLSLTHGEPLRIYNALEPRI